MPPILYRRQKQTLDFISQYLDKFGYSPTLTEIKEALGISSLSTISEHLEALERKKVIRRYKGAVRGIEMTDRTVSIMEKGIEVPILGYIAAGEPIEPYTDPEATVFIPQTMASGKKRAFVLQVKGSSMIEEGILDGDHIVVEEQSEARNGDIIVAILENGFATLKKFFKEKNRIRLEPANARMKPIFARNIKIQGKAVGIIRSWNGIG